jgi:hypothetical protein
MWFLQAADARGCFILPESRGMKDEIQHGDIEGIYDCDFVQGGV